MGKTHSNVRLFYYAQSVSISQGVSSLLIVVSNFNLNLNSELVSDLKFGLKLKMPPEGGTVHK